MDSVSTYSIHSNGCAGLKSSRNYPEIDHSAFIHPLRGFNKAVVHSKFDLAIGQQNPNLQSSQQSVLSEHPVFCIP